MQCGRAQHVCLTIDKFKRVKEQKEKSNEYDGVNKHIIRYTKPFTIPLKDITGIVLWYDNNKNQYFPCAFTLLVAISVIQIQGGTLDDLKYRLNRFISVFGA